MPTQLLIHATFSLTNKNALTAIMIHQHDALVSDGTVISPDGFNEVAFRTFPLPSGLELANGFTAISE